MTRNLRGSLLIASMLVVLWTTSSQACHRRRSCQPTCYYQSGCSYGGQTGYYGGGGGYASPQGYYGGGGGYGMAGGGYYDDGGAIRGTTRSSRGGGGRPRP